MFCIPIEKDVSCGECPIVKTCTCVLGDTCPIVEMPDVEALKAERDLYRGLIDEIISASADCPPGTKYCHDADAVCTKCWREYLEAKLKESEGGK